MLRLLTVEYYKLKYNKTSRVLILGYFILLAAIALLASIKFTLFGTEIRLADQGIFNFPFIWHFNTYVAAILKFFLAVVIVSMTANEYSNRTLKQNLIDGLSKREFILSKFITVVIFSAISTLFIFVLSIILGYSFSDFNELSIVIKETDFLVAFFLKLVAFFSFCLFLGLLIKRSAFALGFLLFWWFFEGICHLILGFVGQKYQLENIRTSIMQFFPLNSMSNLIEMPLTRLNVVKSAANQLQTDIGIDYGIHWYEVLIVSVWIFIFIYSSYALLKKRDL